MTISWFCGCSFFKPILVLLFLSCLGHPLLAQNKKEFTAEDIYTVEGVQYVVRLPENHDPNHKYAALVDIHGGGLIYYSLENGKSDILRGFNKVNHGFPSVLAKGFQPPDELILVFPFLPRDAEIKDINDQLWDIDDIDAVVDDIKQNPDFKIDADRIYMSGISLGGKAVWDYALKYPDKLAAIVPIAGNADPDSICKLKDLAVWALHGREDTFIRPNGKSDSPGQLERYGSYYLVNALKNCPGPLKYNPRVTLIPFISHKQWSHYYDMSSGYNIYEWVLAHERNSTEPIAPFVDLVGGPDKTTPWSDYHIITATIYDSDGQVVEYFWEQLAGPKTTLKSQADTLLVSNFKEAGEYVYKLTIKDDTGLTDSDKIKITLVKKEIPAGAIIILSILVVAGLFLLVKYPPWTS